MTDALVLYRIKRKMGEASGRWADHCGGDIPLGEAFAILDAEIALRPPNTRSIRAQKWYHGITEGESVDAIESQGPGRRTHPTFGRGFALEGESND